MSEQLNKVRHDYIRYANCWEDADILCTSLAIEPNNRVLSIGSGGDNSFSLLLNDPELVVAVDINIAQLHLIELKKIAIKTLNHRAFLEFMGFEASNNRMSTYLELRKELSDDALVFWDQRKDELNRGLIHAGKFERYFQLFRRRILPLIHTKRRIDELFREKSGEEQEVFYHKRWNNFRWRLLFRVFFSKFIMGKFGRDPQFLKEVEIPVADFIFGKAGKHLASTACQQNYLLHYILKGTFGKHLPHYARPENFEKIKLNIDKIVVYQGLAENAFKTFGKFDKFNLSNIFEYMNPEIFSAVCENLLANGKENARYTYWNLMVPRKMHAINANLKSIYTGSEWTDAGFFYSSYFTDEKI